MKISELNAAIKLAEDCAIKYYKKSNIVQSKLIVVVSDNTANVIEEKDVPNLEGEGLIFDVKYIGNIENDKITGEAIAKLRRELTEKKGSATSVYFDSDTLSFLDDFSSKTRKNRSAVINEIIAEFRKK